jgi:hypothetical protein
MNFVRNKLLTEKTYGAIMMTCIASGAGIFMYDGYKTYRTFTFDSVLKTTVHSVTGAGVGFAVGLCSPVLIPVGILTCGIYGANAIYNQITNLTRPE